MATFVNIQAMVAERLGLDLSVTDQATKVKRWINTFQQTLSAWQDWSWLEDRTVLEGVVDITTGTLTATTNSTTITFTSAPSASVAGYYIQTSNSNDWYKISAHTAAATTATLETQYTRTGGAGLVYTLRKVSYSMPSTVDRILSVRQFISPGVLAGTLTRSFDSKFPDVDATGTPHCYYLFGRDSDGNWLFTPYPIPSERLLFEIRSFKKATDLSADADISIVPVKWHQILVEGACLLGAPFVGDTQILKDSKSMVADMLSAMNEEDGQGRDLSSQRRSIDDDFGGIPEPSLPPEYGSSGS